MPSTITTSLLAATFAPSSTKAVSPYETTAETGSGHHQRVDTTTMPFMGLPPRDEMDALAALPRLTHQEAVDVSNYQSPIVMSFSCLPRRQLKQHKPDSSLSAHHHHNERAVPMDAPFNPRRAVQPNPAERALWAFKQRRYAARGLTEKPKPTRTTMTFERRPVVQPPQREQEQQKQSQLARLLAQHGDDSSLCAPAAAFRRDTQAYQRVRFAGDPEAYRQRRGQQTMPPRARSPPPRLQKYQKQQKPVVVVNDDPEIQAILAEIDTLFDYLPTVHTTTTTTKNQSRSQRDADTSTPFLGLSTRRFTPYQFEYGEFSSSSSSSSKSGSSSQEMDEDEEEGDERLYCDGPESDDSDSDSDSGSDHDEDEDEDDDGDDDDDPPPQTSAPSPAPVPQPNNPHAARFKQLFGAGYDVNDLPDAFDDGDDEHEDDDFI